jgi:hypothetical protein
MSQWTRLSSLSAFHQALPAFGSSPGSDRRSLSACLLPSCALKPPVTAALYYSLAVLVKLRTAFRANRAGTRRRTAGCVPKPARSAGRAAVRREDSPAGPEPRRYRFGSTIFIQTASLSSKDI